jgi:hypothetical protein
MKKTWTANQPMDRKQPRSGFAAASRTDQVPAPSREEARRRIRGRPGFYASLSPAARAAIDAYRGPEVIGPPR